jgi:hypothetical protein
VVAVGVVVWLLHCMVSQLQPLRHVVSLNCEDCSDWTTKDEVSRKKENKKRKQKMKMKKEKCTSRVSWHEEHSEMACTPVRGTAMWHVW